MAKQGLNDMIDFTQTTLSNTKRTRTEIVLFITDMCINKYRQYGCFYNNYIIMEIKHRRVKCHYATHIDSSHAKTLTLTSFQSKKCAHMTNTRIKQCRPLCTALYEYLYKCPADWVVCVKNCSSVLACYYY